MEKIKFISEKRENNWREFVAIHSNLLNNLVQQDCQYL